MRSPGVLVVAVALAAGGAFALFSLDTTPPPLSTGQRASAFDLPTLAGDQRVRLQDLEGQVVLLNFWATWCKPCEDEMPSMERLHKQFQGQPFRLLAVSVDAAPAEVKAFQERLGLTLPILFDPDKRVAAAYQAFRFPETILIDAQGNVAGHFVGPRDWDSQTYVEKIRLLLAGAKSG